MNDFATTSDQWVEQQSNSRLDAYDQELRRVRMQVSLGIIDYPQASVLMGVETHSCAARLHALEGPARERLGLPAPTEEPDTDDGLTCAMCEGQSGTHYPFCPKWGE